MRGDLKSQGAQSRANWGWGWPSSMRWHWDWTTSPPGSRCWQSNCAEKLAKIPGVTVRDLPGSGSQPRCGIVTFTHDAHDARAIVAKMREDQINVRVTPLRSTRIDMEQRGLTAMVRASVHYYNSEEEIARFVHAVGAI